MAATLPLICFGLYFFLFTRNGESYRESFLKAAVVWGLFAVAITEISSPFNLLLYPVIALGWLLFGLFPAFLIWRRRRYYFSGFTPAGYRLRWGQLKTAYLKLSLLELLGLAVTGEVVLITGLLALLTPPNNFDSMTYHLPRVMHWIQNQGVTFYPTAYLPQLHQGPGAEFLVLQFQLLSGSDIFANMVQWWSMLVCLAGVSLIAQSFGAENRGQWLAAAFCATLPMGILQATTTQNDYVTACWLVCFIAFFLRWKENGDKTVFLLLSISLGLAILTKPVAYLVAFPFVLYLFGAKLKPFKANFLLLLLVFGSAVILINSGQYLRNFSLYGSPFGPGEELPAGSNFFYLNRDIGVQTLFSNFLRNLSLHLATPFPVFNRGLQDALLFMHNLIGADASNPATTWGGNRFTVFTLRAPDEDATGNLWHTLLIFAAIILFLARRRWRGNQNLLAYLLCLVGGIALFCLLLTFQPWNSRLHLPFFVLFMPFTAMLLGEIRPSILPLIIVLALGLFALPNLFLNPSKPLVGEATIFNTDRLSGYYMNNPGLEESYRQATALIKAQNCSSLGLMLNPNEYEYPIWKLLETPDQPPMHIESVNVPNLSARLQPPGEVDAPCAIFSTRSSGDSVSIGGHAYKLIGIFQGVKVFKY